MGVRSRKQCCSHAISPNMFIYGLEIGYLSIAWNNSWAGFTIQMDGSFMFVICYSILCTKDIGNTVTIVCFLDCSFKSHSMQTTRVGMVEYVGCTGLGNQYAGDSILCSQQKK
jgi:hypothetical protein